MPTLNLSDFEIDPARGFLPAQDPVRRLPAAFAAWDALGENMPALLLAGKLRAQVLNMPLPATDQLNTRPEQERALMLLCFFANAYVWSGPAPALRLPRNLAQPLWQLADTLGRKPIVHYACNALSNWRRIDLDGGVDVENLAVLQGFLGGSDEAWFYLVSAAIEGCGAPALPALVQAQDAVAVQRPEVLIACLQRITQTIDAVTALTLRMYEKCDPHVFYHRIRPFVAGWPEPGLIYEGVSETPLKMIGGSAAQSSLIQAFDAGLGVRHASGETSPFLKEMRNYMPPKHRDFLVALEHGPNVHTFVNAHTTSQPQLTATYNTCVDALANFRRTHMEMAVRYVTLQDPNKKDELGTGGTNLARFLGIAKNETRDAQL